MKKRNLLVLLIMVWSASSNLVYASIFDRSSDSEDSTIGQVHDSLGGSDLGASEATPPVEEAVVETVAEVKAEEPKADTPALKEEPKESAEEALSKAEEVERKANDVKAQSENVARLEKKLEAEKAQLETMKSDFCQNFPKDCGKVNGGVSSKSSGFFGKSKD